MKYEPKDRLKELVGKYLSAKKTGQLQKASEATMRTWIDEFLHVFGWDVHNTLQVQTERTLGKQEKARLHEIGSTNTRPDYTLANGSVKLVFVDAKSLSVDISTDKEAAFQIRSYGWSIGAPFSIVTNFEQLAVYDCSAMPHVSDEADFARIHFLNVNEYVDAYEKLHSFLFRDNVLEGNVKFVRGKGNALDENFSRMLGEIRKDLAKAIRLRNTIGDMGLLSFYVQVIINRVLFIRVCEARGLEKEGLLKEFADDNFWERFKQSSYGEFYEHYDGPMFRRLAALQNLQIDNDVFMRFLDNLYYPSPYRFDVIPLKTISDIYDLFLGFQLVEKEGKMENELREEFKKSNGAVTTPREIVSQVVKCTFDGHVDKLPISEILKLRIADISCGSGVFLVGAYEYLVKQIGKCLRSGETIDCGFAILRDDEMVLTIEGKKAIINNCLYGVDINPEAVEVAKMSLSLKVIDDYDPKDFGEVGIFGSQILNGIGTNIRCGNSLVGSDIDDVCPEIRENIAELQATNAFDWWEIFPEIFDMGGFDYIIGNPPYVEVKNYNTGLPYMAQYIKRVFSSSRNGKIDLAIPFIEKGLWLLNDKGRLGYIVQKRFFKTEYGKGIRKFLTSRKLLNGIYDYAETNLFAGRITYVAILMCDKRKEDNRVVWYMRSDAQNHVLLPAQILNESPWNFENAALNELRLRLARELGTLGDVCKVKVGVQVLWNDAYQIVASKVENGILYGCSKIDDEVEVELEACRVLLCNEDFSPLTVRDHKTYALFPYEVTDNGKVIDLSMSEFANRYPKAGAYLARHRELICENVETLPQKTKKYDADEYWHLFTRKNNHGATYPKLCVPMTAHYPQASVVMDKNVYCDNANMFFVQSAKPDETHLYALAAIISSTIFSTFARAIANPQQNGYYKFNKQFLAPVPFPKDAFLKGGKAIKELAKIAKQIEQTNEEIRNRKGLQTSGLQLSLKSLWQQLDQICDQLYGIKKAGEKAILYSTIRYDRNPYGEES